MGGAPAYPLKQGANFCILHPNLSDSLVFAIAKEGQMKRLVFIGLIFVVALVFAAGAEAKVVFGRRDRDKDRVADRKEIRAEKRQEIKKSSRVNTWWESRADTNNDGRVDRDELAAWRQLEKERIDLNQDGNIDAKEKRLCWMHARSRVNTALEAKYDTNGDGWLEPDEVRSYLTDRYAVVKTNGRAVVDSDLEAEYDTNHDGVIDSDEVQLLKSELYGQ
jgi:Ca2+-binding EF-hand superfamily protein